MASIKYKVPIVQQAKTMSCWYASVVMIGYTYEAGPRKGLPDVWVANTGISVKQVKELGKVEHLKMLKSKDHEFSAASLIATLRAYGPIWSAGMWFGVAHAVVITGCDDTGEGTVYFNDPGDAKAKTGTIKWFNEKRIRGTMMARGYPPTQQA